MRLRSLAVLLSLSVAACFHATGSPPAVPAGVRNGLTWTEVLRLNSARDYFTLRDRLEKTGEGEVPPARYARALIQHAFNAPAASNATIVSLLSGASLPDSLAADLRQIQLANHLRLFEYAAGLAVADALLADTVTLSPAELRDVRNLRRVFRALAAVPPQTSEVRGPSRLRLYRGRVPVQVNDSVRSYGIDTGANLSVLMRSEAEALGLRILPAGIDVGTSTDQRITADLGVADRLTIGEVHYRNVVFLVLDDELLTFPDGSRIPGLIGFPVIEGMGEIQMSAAGELFVPEVIPARPQPNLALHELTPLTRVRWGKQVLLCRLDTGAGTTQLYEPFYRRFRERIDAAAEATTRPWGGAGGVRELPVRILSDVELALGDTAVALDSVAVLTQSIVRSEAENYLDCNIGRDILGSFSRYVLNFRDMAFLLR
ncbi:MAG: retropepsin-like domain-containing protein [Chloroflexota bacterium]|nr:retropepsin-like domain-containing protein [Chloroflexota bacterium]